MLQLGLLGHTVSSAQRQIKFDHGSTGNHMHCGTHLRLKSSTINQYINLFI